MKNLIVYYSFTQNNEKLAKYLQQHLGCDIVKIETLRKRTGFSILLDLMFNRQPKIKTVPYYLRDYDHIIFIAPIWAGKIAMPLKTFLANETNNIKQYSFVTLCGGGNAAQKEKLQRQLKQITGKSPDNAVELWVNDLLPTNQRDTIKYVTGYRIDPTEFKEFDRQIQEIIDGIRLRDKIKNEPQVV